ncbi:hypothetical protein EYF80_014156 [Liparis tanakae]|uniref:Uncharacterized protein n=1 Tax=Liparis tanakae TaxID=230148 RepID=A0A4Z2IC74_9TELE|nr:hypothetical protein EYF80_014156 [Liparis tanakae]
MTILRHHHQCLDSMGGFCMRRYQHLYPWYHGDTVGRNGGKSTRSSTFNPAKCYRRKFSRSVRLQEDQVPHHNSCYGSESVETSFALL